MKLELIQSKHISHLLNIAADPKIAKTSGVPENCSELDAMQWFTNSLQMPAT